MNAILVSVPPEVCARIANGEQTLLLMKRIPKLDAPYKVYMYCTKKRHKDQYGDLVFYRDENGVIEENGEIYSTFECGKVIGSFVCEKQEKFTVGSLRSDDIEKLACVSYSEMISLYYKSEELDGKTVKFGYGLHIPDLKIYDTPKALGEFKTTYHCFNDRKVKFHTNPIIGDIRGNYKDISFCRQCCKYYNSEFQDCMKQSKPLTRPPAMWCYVEELSE